MSLGEVSYTAGQQNVLSVLQNCMSSVDSWGWDLGPLHTHKDGHKNQPDSETGVSTSNQVEEEGLGKKSRGYTRNICQKLSI